MTKGVLRRALIWFRAVAPLSGAALLRLFAASPVAAAAHFLAVALLREAGGGSGGGVGLLVLAHTDALTGLPNRRAWYDALHRALRSAIRTGGTISVGVLDLDEFKRINDDHGHQAGDRLLRELAAGWERELRGSDVVARLGGDEFAVLLNDCAGEEAEAIVDRLRLTAPPGHSVSAGVATWDGLETADAVVARADAALYEAKASGRGRLAVAAR